MLPVSWLSAGGFAAMKRRFHRLVKASISDQKVISVLPQVRRDAVLMASACPHSRELSGSN